MSMPVPNYEVVERPDLYDRDGQTTFYRLTPVRGARVEGVIAVGMAAIEAGHATGATPRYIRDSSELWPQMWVELSPRLADEDGQVRIDPLRALPVREALRINGKAYDNNFHATVTFLRREHDDERALWYPAVTVDGCRYLLADRIVYYPSWTDKARKLLEPLLHTLAAEYVTTARWRNQLITEAVRGVDRAKTNVAAKQGELNEAKAELDAAWRKVDEVTKQFTEEEMS